MKWLNEGRSFVCLCLCAGWLLPGASQGLGQSLFLNVTNFGACGDAVNLSVNITSNSPMIGCPLSPFILADVGKVVELFGGGAATGPTNHQDLVATIVGVGNDGTATLDRPCGVTTNGLGGVYGRNNAAAFQSVIDACKGTNTVVNIPAGQYLLLSPQVLDRSFVMSNMFETYAAVIIQKGGITFAGAGADQSALLGCGAWQLKGAYAYRGYIFACQGPVTNDAPLVFDRLTMDGGARPGRSDYAYFPASPINGAGWDPTHDAVIDTGTAPYHQSKVFQNCGFRNWRGEMLKSVVSVWDGFVEVTNCAFLDGNATAFNFTFTHTIEHCYFSNLVQAVEFYQGYCSNACYFQNNTVTDMAQALYAVTGALTNHYNQPYNLVSNVFYLQHGQNGIQTTPAQNVNIIGNRFIGDSLAITLGSSGYQGSDINSNIVIAGNTFSNVLDAVMIEGSGNNAAWEVTVTNNTISAPPHSGNFGFAAGYGWATNVVVRDNVSTGLAYGLDSTRLGGQWYTDAATNQFPIWADYGGAGTNVISYARGRRHRLDVANAQAIFVLEDTHPRQVPAGASLEIANPGNYTVRAYGSQRMTGRAVTLTAGQTVTFYWTGNEWTNAVRQAGRP